MEDAQSTISELIQKRPGISVDLIREIRKETGTSKADMQIIKKSLGLVSVPVKGQQYWVDPDGLE